MRKWISPLNSPTKPPLPIWNPSPLSQLHSLPKIIILLLPESSSPFPPCHGQFYYVISSLPLISLVQHVSSSSNTYTHSHAYILRPILFPCTLFPFLPKTFIMSLSVYERVKNVGFTFIWQCLLEVCRHYMHRPTFITTIVKYSITQDASSCLQKYKNYHIQTSLNPSAKS